jgi:5-methylcytosine-specific restriction protein B
VGLTSGAKVDEVERRRLKLDSVWQAIQAETAYLEHRRQIELARRERAVEALQLLDDLRASRDPDAFRNALQVWSQREGYESFNFAGMMTIHQIVNYTDDAPIATDVLLDALSVPQSVDEAAAKIRRCVVHIDKIKKGGHPAPRRAPFVLSLFWSLADHEEWPCLWQSADAALTALGWLTPPGDLDEWYIDYRDIVMSSGRTPFEVEELLWWMDNSHPFTGLDPALVDRCRESVELGNARSANNNTYASPSDAAKAERNARAILGELKLVGSQLESRVSNALGRNVTPRVPGVKYADDYRADGYVAWMTGKASDEPSLWLWATDQGVVVGLQPGWQEQGWTDKVRAELVGQLPEGVEFLRFRNRVGDRIEPTGTTDPGGQFLVGRLYPGESSLGDPAFAEEIERVAAALQPVLDRVTQLSGGTGKLAELAARFVAERPYPAPIDTKNIEDRANLATALTPESLNEFDLDAFRQILTTQRYGGPGPMSILNRSLSEANADELARLADSIRYLLWDDTSPDADRIDRILDQQDLGIRGLGESVVMKMLAIVHPDVYLPAFPYRGDNGKKRFMELLGLPALDQSLSPGRLQVDANRALRDVLEPLFPSDPWAQAQFLYWLAKLPPENGGGGEEVVTTSVDLSALNDELLLETGFLDEVVELLEEKGQVIFYGPPGTGKTFIAKRLAAALAADPSRSMIVQFHPSTSYEDFFEGYRPCTNDDGQMTYELVPGPLARMAELAALAPATKHIIVVDEINRANLPKVFGELLFLLEYRDESIQMLYRPDTPFRLPPNLWMIGTMNTADRSIALVDAALRRRFHFVPFFPEQDQMQGLLHRWLEHNDGDARIASLVEQVNQELVQDVGEHLQIGPSYFMRPGIGESDLRRIWKYSIEPFVEEQLFGQPEEIKRYRWSEVRQRYWGTLTAATDDPTILEEDTPEIADGVGE